MTKYVSETTCNARHSALKEDVEEMRADVKKILTNDIPHLQKSVSELKIYFAIIGSIISIIGPLVVNYITKILGLGG